MRKWILIVVVALIAICGYFYLYQDHRDIESESATFTVIAKDIGFDFQNQLNDAEDKYLNQTIIVKGLITEIGNADLTLDDIVFCQFDTIITTTEKNNSSIKINGRVIGYDDLLEQVKLDQCTIIK